jgi:hypothetical protein
MYTWFSFLVVTLALAYIVKVMLLEEKEDHEGPWPSAVKKVYFQKAEHIQRVALFDYIRRIFGAYHVSGDLWTVNEGRAEVWTCPTCLSFWLAMPFSFILFLSEPFWQSGFVLILPFALASLSRLIIRYAFGV